MGGNLMNQYVVEITETLQRQLAIFAESQQEAVDTIFKNYKNGNIILYPEDFIEYKIDIIE